MRVVGRSRSFAATGKSEDSPSSRQLVVQVVFSLSALYISHAQSRRYLDKTGMHTIYHHSDTSNDNCNDTDTNDNTDDNTRTIWRTA